MCYKVKVRVIDVEMQERFDAIFEVEPYGMPGIETISGFDHALMPVITTDDPGKIVLMRWGLIPGWVKDEAMAQQLLNSTLNARSETIFEKPSFRSITTKRCLIPVNGFYEWQHEGKRKVPYYISLKSESLFALGGLYDEWVNTVTGEIYKGFSIVTVAANPLMERIHNTKKRMPLILPRAIEKQWLNPSLDNAAIKGLITQYPEEDMQAVSLQEMNSTPTLFG